MELYDETVYLKGNRFDRKSQGSSFAFMDARSFRLFLPEGWLLPDGAADEEAFTVPADPGALSSFFPLRGV